MSDTGPPSQPDIVVNGYSPRFVAAVAKLLSIEGGFVDDPADHGGATKYGISLRFLAAQGAFDADHDGKADFDLNMDGDIDGQDIRLLRRSDAIALYWRCFWVPLQAETLTAPFGEMLFDQAVNGGIISACKLLQRAINDGLLLIPASRAKVGLLTVDGAIGPATRKAMLEVLTSPSVGSAGLVTAYRNAAAERYRSIVFHHPDQKPYLNGWLARANQLGRA